MFRPVKSLTYDELSRNQKRILKKLRKLVPDTSLGNEQYSSMSLEHETFFDVNNLEYAGLIEKLMPSSIDDIDTEKYKYYYNLTNKGMFILNKRKYYDFHFWLPTTLSVIAIILSIIALVLWATPQPPAPTPTHSSSVSPDKLSLSSPHLLFYFVLHSPRKEVLIMTEEKLKLLVEDAYKKGIVDVLGSDVQNSIAQIISDANGDIEKATAKLFITFAKINNATLYHALHNVFIQNQSSE